LVTDFRYYEQVRREAPGHELVKAPTTREAALAPCVAELDLKRIGFEADHVTVQTLGRWRKAMADIAWVETDDIVAGLRAIKDEDEIRAMERAVHIADAAMAHIMGWIKPGLTEREVAWELEVYMRTHGAQGLSFATIVASGTNASMAHAVTSEREICEGDPVVIDMGCVHDGYCSDLTRSFCLGSASEAYLRAWETVRRAQVAAEQAITAGMSGVEADAVARGIIDGDGHEGKFGHGLGHGVGLEIHEAPRASRTSEDTLLAGMVLTVEPGIYDPAWGGIRIEDMVVVGEEGCRILTEVEKSPVV
jgi:Xaa-Pro aminopeptidase